MESDSRIEALEAATLPLLITPRDEHVVVVARLVAVITAGLAAGRFLLDGPTGLVGWVLAIAALGFGCVPAVLRRTKDRRRAGGLVPVIGLAALTCMSLAEGGLRSEAMYWLPLVPIIAAVTRDPGKGTTVFSGLAFALVGLLTGLQLAGRSFGFPEESFAMLMLRSGGLAGAVGAGGVVAWALERAWTTAATTIAAEAAHHPVTGLASRAAFDRDLNAALSRGFRQGRDVAVAYIDLDHFKQVNDRFGHAAGDTLLRLVAKKLTDVTRDGETAFHLAGDEFAVVFEDVDRKHLAVPAHRIAEALRGLAAGPADELVLSASVGIAMALPAESAASLVAHADRAMYGAKELGGGAVEAAAIAPPHHGRAESGG
ncbi:MAG: GGDEF domain-containing protein [Proteobacteria bacterium]|nr:GGDEF domain-containing protein [Pseudomonadota bacterium]